MGPDVWQTFKWVFSGFAIIDRFSVNIGRPCEGLKFKPSPQRNLPEMEKDIKDFTRKFGLVEFFSENPELDTPDSSLVKSKSNFCPPQNRNTTLESVIKFLQKQSFYNKNFKNKSHISKHE